jgi:hypothetical protein
MQDGGCTSDAPADASGMTGEEWADMFPVPEGFTLEGVPAAERGTDCGTGPDV